jgi:hypothetical protein
MAVPGAAVATGGVAGGWCTLRDPLQPWSRRALPPIGTLAPGYVIHQAQAWDVDLA